MYSTIKAFWRAAAILGILCLVSACATTTAPTESSTKTTGNTTDASTKFTSSTSPGGGSSDSAKNEQALAFAKVNLERIKTDMALGGGEHLTSLATLMEVPARNQPEFFAMTKANFSTLFGSENTTAEELLAGLDNELSANPNLLK
jgi:PBP1b-binding outer membrane lipoprotein LpoB